MLNLVSDVASGLKSVMSKSTSESPKTSTEPVPAPTPTAPTPNPIFTFSTKPMFKPTQKTMPKQTQTSNSVHVKCMSNEQSEQCKRLIMYLSSIIDVVPNNKIIDSIINGVKKSLSKGNVICDGKYISFDCVADFGDTKNVLINSLEIISSLISDRGILNKFSFDSNKKYLNCMCDFSNFKVISRQSLCHNISELLETIKSHTHHYPDLYRFLRSYVQQHKDFVDEINISNVPFVFDNKNDCEMCMNCLNNDGVIVNRGSNPSVLFFDLTRFNPPSHVSSEKNTMNYFDSINNESCNNRVPTPIPTEAEILEKTRNTDYKLPHNRLFKHPIRLQPKGPNSNVKVTPQKESQQNLTNSTSAENSKIPLITKYPSTEQDNFSDNFLEEYIKLRELRFREYFEKIVIQIVSNIKNDNFTRIKITLFDSISSQDPKNETKYLKELESICGRLLNNYISSNYCIQEKQELVSLNDESPPENNLDYLTLDDDIVENLKDFANCDRLINDILTKHNDEKCDDTHGNSNSNSNSNSDNNINYNNIVDSDSNDENNNNDNDCIMEFGDFKNSSSMFHNYGTFQVPTENSKSNPTKSTPSVKLLEGIININLSAYLSDETGYYINNNIYKNNACSNFNNNDNHNLHYVIKSLVDSRINAIFELAKEEIKADATKFISGNCEILVKCTTDTSNDYELINTCVSTLLNNLNSSQSKSSLIPCKLIAVPHHKQEGNMHIYSISVTIS